MIKHIAAAAVVMSSSLACAGTNPQYVLKRVPMGPRNDNYVLVRVDRNDAERGYALTGDTQERAQRPVAARIPSHVKGTHGW